MYITYIYLVKYFVRFNFNVMLQFLNILRENMLVVIINGCLLIYYGVRMEINTSEHTNKNYLL